MILCPKCRVGEADRDNVDGVYFKCNDCGYYFIVIPKTAKQLIEKDRAEIYFLERRLYEQDVQKKKREKESPPYQIEVQRWKKVTI